MALRNTLAIAAENEIGRRSQQMILDAEFSIDGFGDVSSSNSSNRSLSSRSGRHFLRGIGNTPIRKFSSIQQPMPPRMQSYYLPVKEPPMIWYHKCVSQLLMSHAHALSMKLTEQSVRTVSLSD